MTWRSDIAPPEPRIDLSGWTRAILRGAVLLPLLAGGLLAVSLLKSTNRRAAVASAVSGMALTVIGLRVEAVGRAMTMPGALVANHASWLDILVLSACGRVTFVSKAEVADWPGIGRIARATGTLFIRRDRREATAQRAAIADRIARNERLLFFPEGTSTDGQRVLPFKTTLFAAFAGQPLWIQPVTVIYDAPPGADPRLYGWWGDMALGPHLLRMLSLKRHGRVRVIRHAPIDAAAHPDRKALAQACEDAVRAPFEVQGNSLAT
ncbi:acyltransferase, putative [Oceaniovalibus guishaninsula JLT2003]|uniref:Acyltransferase, putative n=1 Tax=Oceaniovalibus guishaninsula JLT2003 TaxID=1231392 RepID=K2GT52_9RHOB|nr:lysophospholipid acyltransferase family protein [Oceaniovalibus guishaninsula]EKE45721.1 acyltransferase, putative [Oceaniovalibus guishaninsula JLT2003]